MTGLGKKMKVLLSAHLTFSPQSSGCFNLVFAGISLKKKTNFKKNMQVPVNQYKTRFFFLTLEQSFSREGVVRVNNILFVEFW